MREKLNQLGESAMRRGAGSVGVIAAVGAALCSGVAVAQERQWGVNRSIEQISEHVYRWGSDGQFGDYILTSEGIIVIDGHYCPSGTVAWLKGELAARHDVPVKYIVLSHDHQDHNCNSQLFSDTAVAVGHRNIVPHLVREKRLSAIPQVTFEREMDLVLGGVTVTLLYFGPSHSDNLIHVHIPQDKVLISIDVAREGLFPDLRDMDVHSTLKQLKILANLEDVEIVVPGHGPRLLKQDSFMKTHAFLQALHDQVLELMLAGRTLREIRRLVTMEEFRDTPGLANLLDPNIVTMYDFLYRYREPNERISELEAVSCIENSSACRTSD